MALKWACMPGSMQFGCSLDDVRDETALQCQKQFFSVSADEVQTPRDR